MPRAPYYSGSIAGGAQAYAAPAKPSLLQQVLAPAAGMVLGEGLGGMVAQRFRDPNTDPNAMLARQRRAEAIAKELEVERAQAAATALQDFGGTTAAYTRELPERIGANPSADQMGAVRRVMTGAYQGALAAGADPEQASALLNAFYLQFANGEGDNMMTRVNAAGGTYIKADENPSLARQDFQREDNQVQATSIQDSINTTDITQSGIAADASKYGARQAAGASMYGADRGYAASTENNSRDNSTDRYKTVFDATFGGVMDNVPRVESRTTTATDADGKPKGSKTETTTRGIARGGRGAAPAPAANDPFPGIAEGEIVTQGGQRYRRQGNDMVPVT